MADWNAPPFGGCTVRLTLDWAQDVGGNGKEGRLEKHMVTGPLMCCPGPKGVEDFMRWMREHLEQVLIPVRVEPGP